MIDTYVMGQTCKELRVELGITQQQVADETGYSYRNISSFENGRNNNACILLWYISHGYTIRDYERGVMYYGR